VHGLAELLMSGAIEHMGLSDGSPAAIARLVTGDIMQGLERAGGSGA
jgi:hypothetical protein